MTSMYGPVTDWATDLDHAEPEYNERAHEIWDELREGGCPVAHTDRYGGMWAPLTHELVKEVAYDTDHFSSRGVVVNTGRPIAEAPVGPAPPITSDPPFHQIARRLLLPPFSPKAIDPWEPEVRRLCNELLDEMGDDRSEAESVVDAAVQYAQHIPVNVISRMLGFPPEDDDYFRECVHHVLERVNEPVEVREASVTEPRRLPRPPDRRSTSDHPRDDLTTLPARRRDRRQQAHARARARIDGAAADRRHRHDLERDRLVDLAPRARTPTTCSGWSTTPT